MPPQIVEGAASPTDADWPALFRAAGLHPADWTAADPQVTPLFRGPPPGVGAARRCHERGHACRHCEFLGRPVSFEWVFPWSVLVMLATWRSEGERIANLIVVLTSSGLMLGGALAARRSLETDRGDRRGAMRLAVFVAALQMLVWVFDEQHVASIWELYLFLMAAGWACSRPRCWRCSIWRSNHTCGGRGQRRSFRGAACWRARFAIGWLHERAHRPGGRRSDFRDRCLRLLHFHQFITGRAPRLFSRARSTARVTSCQSSRSIWAARFSRASRCC